MEIRSCQEVLTYQETLTRQEVLTYQEAIEVYQAIVSNLDETDEDIMDLFRLMQKNAVRYAQIRSGWFQMEREERNKQDRQRSIYHDAFIASCETMARIEGAAGSKWMQVLGNDRKRIGDFACYIALFLGLEAR